MTGKTTNSAITGIIFDKDGTLFDFALTWESWAQAFLLRLCDGDAHRAANVGQAIGFDFGTLTFAHDSPAIAGTPAELTSALLPHFSDHNFDTLVAVLNEEAEKAPQQAVTPLQPLLSELRARGLLLGVATNDAEAPARGHLGQADVTELFDFIAGFDSGHGGKPAPGQLLAFCAALDLAPKEVVMVGDSTHDLFAGHAAGMRTIGVLTGYAGAADLAPHADVILPDISHLPAWLDAQTAD